LPVELKRRSTPETGALRGARFSLNIPKATIADTVEPRQD
jgi:hypothetical protein